jgi:MoxR-like ATPase
MTGAAPDTQGSPATAQQVAQGLRAAGYLPGDSTALVAFLAIRMGKPILVEGPAGVGKTELAKSLARYLQRELVRLQCYEGLDEAKALYEWNYRKQLLRIQAESSSSAADGRRLEPAGTASDPAHADGHDGAWSEIQDDIFGEDFLLARPLLTAIASQEPVVLLIDEIDKTDQEFEAMLLEVLSDFQISIPELGPIVSRTHPLVLLTSNNSRELTEALKRRCLYLWLDYPAAERELEIVQLHAPDLKDSVARKLVEVVGMVRELDLKKPPSIAESIDWARTLVILGASDIDADVLAETMSVIIKHRTDMDLVAARVGVKLAGGADEAGDSDQAGGDPVGAAGS